MKKQLTAAFVCLRCRRVFKRPSHWRVGDGSQALDYTPRRAQGDCANAFPVFNRGISTIATMNIVMPTPVMRMP